METLDVAKVGREDFSAHLNSKFTLRVDGLDEPLELTLLEEADYPDHRPEAEQTGRKPFSLVFGCSTHPLGQGVYQLEHESLGGFSVFLSPFAFMRTGISLKRSLPDCSQGAFRAMIWRALRNPQITLES